MEFVCSYIYTHICIHIIVCIASNDNYNGFFSKNLGTLWDDLGKAVEGEDEIEIGEVDCGVSKAVCSKVDIHSYPTFKLFYEGEEVTRYQGNVHVFYIFSIWTAWCF